MRAILALFLIGLGCPLVAQSIFVPIKDDFVIYNLSTKKIEKYFNYKEIGGIGWRPNDDASIIFYKKRPNDDRLIKYDTINRTHTLVNDEGMMAAVVLKRNETLVNMILTTVTGPYSYEELNKNSSENNSISYRSVRGLKIERVWYIDEVYSLMLSQQGDQRLYVTYNKMTHQWSEHPLLSYTVVKNSLIPPLEEHNLLQFLKS